MTQLQMRKNATSLQHHLVGVEALIGPCFDSLPVKPNLSAEFTIINGDLAQDLKRLEFWDDVRVMDRKHFEGSMNPIDRVRADIKALYATAFEVETRWLAETPARRQKWIDQVQTVGIYMAGASGKKLDGTCKLAWIRRLNPTFHLRSKSATHAEKSTLTAERMTAVSSGEESHHGASMSAPDVAAAIARLQMTFGPTTDIKFCGVDDPTFEPCQ